MTLLLSIAAIALLAACVALVTPVVVAFCSALERFADSGCICVKGGWDWRCPIHGRDARGEEPFPGAWAPW